MASQSTSEAERAAMSNVMRQLRSGTAVLHRNMKDTADTIGTFLVHAFHLLALFAIGATTVWSAAAAFIGMAEQGRATLEDILLLFIYLEIGAMVGIYFKTTRLPVRYLIYIAITALGQRAHRNSGGRASDWHGYSGRSRGNPASVIRCARAEIRVVSVSVRCSRGWPTA